jgi:hypothetical protein
MGSFAGTYRAFSIGGMTLYATAPTIGQPEQKTSRARQKTELRSRQIDEAADL